MSWDPARLPDLTGHVYAVTGATGGIGYFAAEQLASAGAEVILASRSPQKIGVAAAAICGQVPQAVTGSVAFDLTSLASVGEGAERLAALPRLDGIFLDGGPMGFSARVRTDDGLPLMTGAHTVANVALLAGFLSARASADRDRPLRVVHASTGFVQQFRTEVTDVRAASRTGIGAYVLAKTLTEVFAYELDRRVRAAGLPIASVVTRPDVGVDAKTPQRPGIRDATVPYRRNPYTPWAQGEDAAAWSGVRALTDPDVVGGEFYGPRKVAGPPVRLTPRSTRARRARRLRRRSGLGSRGSPVCRCASRAPSGAEPWPPREVAGPGASWSSASRPEPVSRTRRSFGRAPDESVRQAVTS